MTAWAVIVAAGEGARLGAGEPKALVPLAGRPLLDWSLQAVSEARSLSGVVVACGASWLDRCAALVTGRFGEWGRVCAGGVTRHESVRTALDRVAGNADRVVVHDAARPLATAEMFERALAALERATGAVCAVPVTDTVKRAVGDVIVETVDRASLWRAQTPQAFRLETLLKAHAEISGAGATDDASLLERAGETVVLVRGDERNLKVTTAADLAVAEALLSRR